MEDLPGLISASAVLTGDRRTGNFSPLGVDGTKRLAIVTTHPIQYHAPWFRALHACPQLELQVYFGHRASAAQQAEAGFGVEFEWDAPILEGYPHAFLDNVAARPSALTFFGIDTPEIGQVLARNRFDAVIINGWHYKGAWQAIQACWRNGIPVMARSDSHLHTRRSPLKKFLKWLPYRFFIRRLDACLPVGTWSAEYFLKYGADPDRVHVLPHAVDVDWFEGQARSLASQRTELRRRWGLEKEAAVYLFAAKFTEKKRPFDFLSAVQLAGSRSGARVMGLMVGDGPLRDKCEARARDSNAPIRFTGFLNQSEMPAAFVASDALILPSDGRETWGLVVNEAMACGVPCLVSDQVGCGPDMIIADKTGAVFPIGDLEALAALMVRYAGNGFLRKMTRAAREMARRYSVEEAVAATLEALDKASRDKAS